LNFVSYFAMKNTPKVGSVSNFRGAVQMRAFQFSALWILCESQSSTRDDGAINQLSIASTAPLQDAEDRLFAH
ncbi:hypothetical protein J8I26_19110, partial [Herbaspirillum sp. LeCh32-8]|uniref:hypothetical protein n=1 Tax=Herbaspirillum sp. LeCh32-8 TaxID=2821356 RepID=UPI001AE3998C